MLKDKNVLLGITASIAAYKSANLVRILKKKCANVKVVQTPKSLEFVTSLTLSTLSENPVNFESRQTKEREADDKVSDKSSKG